MSTPLKARFGGFEKTATPGGRDSTGRPRRLVRNALADAGASGSPGGRSPGEGRGATALPFAISLVLAFTALLGPAGEVRSERPASDSAAAPPPVQLEALMDRFASSQGMRVPFRESRRLAILSEPIESEGVFFFAPPGDLARYTLRPGRSRVIVRGDRVLFEDATGRQSFDLSSNETARGFVGNFGVLLRGDLAELRRRYTLDFRTTGDSWTLEMRPRSREMRHLIERIEVQGRGIELHRMETFGTNGDQTALVFGEVVPLSDLDASERDSIFSLDSTGALP